MTQTYVIARIGKPHALRGEVTVQLHTDDPERRLAVGETLQTDPPERGPLTIRSRRVHRGITLLGFEGADDRNAAEALRGTRLVVTVAQGAGAGVPDAEGVEAASDEDDGWYADDLQGLTVRTVEGHEVGTVADLVTRPAQDLLVVSVPGGGEVMVPFVAELVPEVDTAKGVVVIDPPAGLFELAGD